MQEDRLPHFVAHILSEMSRKALREQAEARLAAVICALALLLASVTYFLGSSSGALVFLLAAAVSALLALEPYAGYRALAGEISAIELQLENSGFSVSWSGSIPSASITPTRTNTG